MRIQVAVILALAAFTAARGQTHGAPRIVVESIPSMTAALNRDLASFDHWRSRMTVALRPDSGRARADSTFLRLDQANIDSVTAHSPARRSSLALIGLWPDTAVLAPLRDAFTSRGISLYIDEGEADPTISETANRETVARFLTAPMRTLLDIRVLEQTNPTGGDAAIVISLDELGSRLHAVDQLLADHPAFAGTPEAKRRRSVYLQTFLAGWDNTPAFGDDETMTTDWRAALERFTAVHSRTWAGRTVADYLRLLRANNWRRTGDVKRFIEALNASSP